MSKSSCDISKTVNSLLNAPYPFDHEHFKTIYEKDKDEQSLFAQANLYKCNFCKIKLLGEKSLLEHNKSFNHQAEMEKQIEDMLSKLTLDKKMPTIKLSESTTEMVCKAAVQSSKMKLDEEMAELKCEYELYRNNPALHPMYAKEWHIFYLRRLSEILANNIDPRSHDFTKDWSVYWVKRIQVYYNEALQNIIEKIGKNYISTLSDTGVLKDLLNKPQEIAPSKSSPVLHSILIDSDESTDDQNSCDSESEADCAIDSELNAQSDSDGDDELVTKLRPMVIPQTLLDEAIQLANESKLDTSDNNSDQSTSGIGSDDLDASDVADAVLKFFNACGLNPANLSDSQVEQYIEYFVLKQTENPKPRADSVETQTSSDSGYK
ncbi:uncharacterized protein LOC116352297 [Contarinia nasturtii]|uniref:uncharacterized protein LOC116352297 n=1 Tax=Contarinia nasturtii TaxID=265458 RepID=UPI0012D4B48B|nr:uncharacterized protein LOC116352297 [Contarinia nasturtii]